MTKKGKQGASADFGLIALVYNLKRLINLGWKPKTTFIRYLKVLYKLITLQISCLTKFETTNEILVNY
jgi:hypothetical protein